MARSWLARLAGKLATAIVRCHLATMEMASACAINLLPRERDILRHRFWATAFERLKGTGAVYFALEGKMKGCWVLRLQEDESGHQDPDKILVRSDGTTTYVGKDIAYQMWKLGLLGEDFGYEHFHAYPDGHVLWTTRPDALRNGAPPFGAAQKVINVIDTRQSYLQRVVKEGLKSQGFKAEAEASVHFSYEMVALSPKCAEDLGLALSEEDRGKPFVEMSGRKGLGVKADELLDRLDAGAFRRVKDANPDLDEERARSLASKIARAALRYSMCKPGRTKIIAFDFDEALAFEGDTGPYLLYGAVRARSIFHRLATEQGCGAGWVEGCFDPSPILAPLPKEEQDAAWGMIALALRLPQVAKSALDGIEISVLSRYAFQLGQEWNTYYHRFHILRETDPVLRRARAATAWLLMGRLVQTLDLLGIDVPERM
ncbi:MAG: DALR anticodon-binding domain-containing protein [Acidobacteriota bacterium]